MRYVRAVMWLSLVYDGLINFRGSADSCFCLPIFTLTLLFNFVKKYQAIALIIIKLFFGSRLHPCLGEAFDRRGFLGSLANRAGENHQSAVYMYLWVLAFGQLVV